MVKVQESLHDSCQSERSYETTVSDNFFLLENSHGNVFFLKPVFLTEFKARIENFCFLSILLHELLLLTPFYHPFSSSFSSSLSYLYSFPLLPSPLGNTQTLLLILTQLKVNVHNKNYQNIAFWSKNINDALWTIDCCYTQSWHIKKNIVCHCPKSI